MSKWLMRGHFGHLHFKPFQRCKEHLKTRCFDPCNWTLSFRESQRALKSHFREWVATSHFPQSGVATLKIARVPVVEILGFPLGSPRTKSHLDVALMERHKIYYKGEGGGFPQVRSMVSFMCLSCLWFVLAPKVLQLCTNHPVLVLCRSVWIIEACQFLPSPIPKLQHAPLPSKCYKPGSGPNSLIFCCFQFGTHIWIPQGIGSTSHIYIQNLNVCHLFLNLDYV
jgi:hypothetical protein